MRRRRLSSTQHSSNRRSSRRPSSRPRSSRRDSSTGHSSRRSSRRDSSTGRPSRRSPSKKQHLGGSKSVFPTRRKIGKPSMSRDVTSSSFAKQFLLWSPSVSPSRSGCSSASPVRSYSVRSSSSSSPPPASAARVKKIKPVRTNKKKATKITKSRNKRPLQTRRPTISVPIVQRSCSSALSPRSPRSASPLPISFTPTGPRCSTCHQPSNRVVKVCRHCRVHSWDKCVQCLAPVSFRKVFREPKDAPRLDRRIWIQEMKSAAGFMSCILVPLSYPHHTKQEETDHDRTQWNRSFQMLTRQPSGSQWRIVPYCLGCVRSWTCRILSPLSDSAILERHWQCKDLWTLPPYWWPSLYSTDERQARYRAWIDACTPAVYSIRVLLHLILQYAVGHFFDAHLSCTSLDSTPSLRRDVISACRAQAWIRWIHRPDAPWLPLNNMDRKDSQDRKDGKIGTRIQMYAPHTVPPELFAGMQLAIPLDRLHVTVCNSAANDSPIWFVYLDDSNDDQEVYGPVVYLLPLNVEAVVQFHARLAENSDMADTKTDPAVTLLSTRRVTLYRNSLMTLQGPWRRDYSYSVHPSLAHSLATAPRADWLTFRSLRHPPSSLSSLSSPSSSLSNHKDEVKCDVFE